MVKGNGDAVMRALGACVRAHVCVRMCMRVCVCIAVCVCVWGRRGRRRDGGGKE